MVGSDAPNSFMVKFPKSSVKEITVGSMRAYGWKAAISEIAFYKYDSHLRRPGRHLGR